MEKFPFSTEFPTFENSEYLLLHEAANLIILGCTHVPVCAIMHLKT
jgi:hypothetical protein